MIDFSTVIFSLVPNAQCSYFDNKIMTWDDSRAQPTEDEINAKIAELEAEYDANEYQRQRALEYPSWQDQLDKIYHDGVMAWQQEIKAIKEKYPKS